jgi:hypothetical protein
MILLMVVLTVMSIITLTIIMTPVSARNNKANTLILIIAATVNEGALATNKGKGKGIGSKYYDLTILIFTIEI